MTTNNLWFWKQNRKEPVRQQVEFVHQTEVSCSNGHDTNYMTIKEYRKWINSLPKELDEFELVHREYYDSTDDEILAKETQVYSVHIDERNKKGCNMHQDSYLKYNEGNNITKIDVPNKEQPTH